MNENSHETQNRPLRILHILEATTGGTGRHLVELVSHLDRERFIPSVLCSTRRDRRFIDEIRNLREQGITVTEVDMKRRIAPLSDFMALLHILKHIRSTRPDIVHTHSSKAGFLGRLAARLAGSPTAIYTPHGFPFQMEVGWGRRFLYKALEKVAARWTDIILCVSHSERDLALKMRLVAPNRLHVIPNGIAPRAGAMEQNNQRTLRAELGLPIDDRPLIGAIGRVTRQKGYEDFLRAAKLVIAICPNALFVIIGEGEQRPALEALVNRLGLNSALFMPGQRPHANKYYRAMDIFVMPSLWEALPYTLLDAMAAGVPTVATSVGGIPELISANATGLLVPPHDSVALADAIIRLIKDKPLRQHLGSEATKEVRETYTMDAMVKEIERIYTSLFVTQRTKHLFARYAVRGEGTPPPRMDS